MGNILNKCKTGNQTQAYVEEVMKERKAFSQDFLFYGYYFVTKKREQNKQRSYYGPGAKGDEDKGPLESSLWKTMMKTYEEVLSNTSDKEG